MSRPVKYFTEEERRAANAAAQRKWRMNNLPKIIAKPKAFPASPENANPSPLKTFRL